MQVPSAVQTPRRLEMNSLSLQVWSRPGVQAGPVAQAASPPSAQLPSFAPDASSRLGSLPPFNPQPMEVHAMPAERVSAAQRWSSFGNLISSSFYIAATRLSPVASPPPQSSSYQIGFSDVKPNQPAYPWSNDHVRGGSRLPTHSLAGVDGRAVARFAGDRSTLGRLGLCVARRALGSCA
jgi:hypothetical protein